MALGLALSGGAYLASRAWVMAVWLIASAILLAVGALLGYRRRPSEAARAPAD
jgi:hypothetical protein